jgi:TM2 domain-containing membrane protein YozV
MTEGPQTPDPNQPEGQPDPPYGEPTTPYGQPAPYQQSYPQPGYQQPGYQQPGYQPGYQQPGYPPPGGYAYANPAAPYGVHPVTGVPYSDKSKLVAGLLQVLIPLGIGRFYIGDTTTGVLQLVVTLVTCGIGGLWPFIDGIVILAGDPKDAQGRPLRPS